MKKIATSGMEGALAALAKSIARWTDKGDRLDTAVPGLMLYRRDEPSPPTSIMYEPRICIVAQGAKRVLLEGQRAAVCLSVEDAGRLT